MTKRTAAEALASLPVGVSVGGEASATVPNSYVDGEKDDRPDHRPEDNSNNHKRMTSHRISLLSPSSSYCSLAPTSMTSAATSFTSSAAAVAESTASTLGSSGAPSATANINNNNNKRSVQRTVSCISTTSTSFVSSSFSSRASSSSSSPTPDQDAEHVLTTQANKKFELTNNHHPAQKDLAVQHEVVEVRNLLRFDNAQILQRNGSLLKGSLTVDLDSGLIVSIICLPMSSNDATTEGGFMEEETNTNTSAVGYGVEDNIVQVIDCQNQILSPGYIDIQLNGAYGVDFSNAGSSSPSKESRNGEDNNGDNRARENEEGRGGLTIQDMLHVSSRLVETGVTSYCPTMVSSSKETYRKILPLVREARCLQWEQRRRQHQRQSGHRQQQRQQHEQGPNGNIARIGVEGVGANILGMHLEGPFFSPSKRGAHDEGHIVSPVKGIDTVKEIYGPDLLPRSNVDIITMAPELEGALDAIASLTGGTAAQPHHHHKDDEDHHGIVVSMGHTSATYQEGLAALSNGASLLTHLYNAMNPFHHRNPGLVGLLSAQYDIQKLNNGNNNNSHQHKKAKTTTTTTTNQTKIKQAERPFYSMIVDGIHVHPSAVTLAYSSHPTGCVLVTDAMTAMGLGDGIHTLGNMSVNIRGDKATLVGTDTLAGSVVSMETCVKRFREFVGCGIGEALVCATLNPARVLGRDVVRKTSGKGMGNGNGVVEPPIGVLEVGAKADLILIDEDLDVLGTWVDGYLAFEGKMLSNYFLQ